MPSDDQSKVAMIRDAMPVVKQRTFLNTGSYGPLPRPTVEVMVDYLARELEEGRAFDRARSCRSRTAAEIAEFFGCTLDNIALTRHTSDGMNIGILGLNWRPNDEIVLTNLEHPGGQGPAYNVARRYGVTIRTARLGNGSGDVIGAIERVLTPRTRAVVVSHVAWNTGAVLPIAEIADLVHQHRAVLIVDGAQSAGSIPLCLPDLGVDVYAMPGQKWLCGPEGTGAIYVSDDALELIQPTFVGGATAAGWEHVGGYFLPRPGAGRYEVGGVNQAAVEGLGASLRWVRESVGQDWACERIARLGRYAWDRLEAIEGVRLITPRDCMAGLVSFNLEGIAPQDLTQRLAQIGVEIRYILAPLCARVSTGFYNDESDIDRLVAGIEEIRSSLPVGA